MYTLGAHADDRHVLVDPAEVGATLERTDRGGDVTYHGPGQFVAYPIVTVPDDVSSGPAHVHRLERLVIDTLADVGLPGCTSDGSSRACGSTPTEPRPARSPPSACAPSGGGRGAGAPCTASPST